MREQVKLVFVGMTSTGKSSLIQRVIQNQFTQSSPTISVSCESLQFKRNGVNINLQLWDTSGSEQFQQLSQTYYRSCNAVAVVCSVDQQDSFVRATQLVHQIRSMSDDNIRIYLLLNKIDLQTSGIVTANKLADAQFAKLFKVSAKTGENVQQFIECVLDEFTESLESFMDEPSVEVQRAKMFCCCQGKKK
ncbi:Rab1a [Hexamita inflata]|uniref:Rab1a n=1 Tax=Hexamita inflata TaxID=28002 RepID=A0AA86UEJ0_9EUKA|nr:Rab1a [Hexamita inflata]